LLKEDIQKEYSQYVLQLVLFLVLNDATLAIRVIQYGGQMWTGNVIKMHLLD